MECFLHFHQRFWLITFFGERLCNFFNGFEIIIKFWLLGTSVEENNYFFITAFWKFGLNVPIMAQKRKTRRL
jgi:hypothetical protein